MWIVVAAWIAASLVFSSFFMKTMIPLRVIAIASNVAFIIYGLLGLTYGVFGRVYPILILHSCLLPLNVLRLRQVTALIAAVHEASEQEALRALIPYMTSEHRRSGDVLFRRGDPANRLYLVQRGSVAFPEIDKRVSTGSVFGEVGLFAPKHVRSATAVCEEECRLATISGDKALELYYQDPRFGLFLIRLISGYALQNPGLDDPAATPAHA
jgi:CRP/FNR family transcriptional regulator, cyclic AMP receptor protein